MWLLSRDCDGCPEMRRCTRRYIQVMVGEMVSCPDGTRHLVDAASVEVAPIG